MKSISCCFGRKEGDKAEECDNAECGKKSPVIDDDEICHLSEFDHINNALNEDERCTTAMKQEEQLCDLVFGNTLIVSRILSFLPLYHLAKCCLINQLWYREANSYFYEIDTIESEDDSEERKIVSHVKYVNISFWDPIQHILRVKQILRLTPNVEELKLVRQEAKYYEIGIQCDDPGFKAEISFPNLTVLTISSDMRNDHSSGRNLEELVATITKNAPNLSVFKMKNASSPAQDLSILSKFVQLNPKKLNEIHLHYAEGEMIRVLLKFNAQLRILNIGVMHPNGVFILGEVLSKFANSLEEINIGVGFTIWCGKISSFDLPRLKNLRILKYRALDDSRPIYVGRWDTDYMQERMRMRLAISGNGDMTLFDYLNISRIFEDGGEQFKFKFPKLTHIELSVDNELLHGKFHDVFFSKVGKNVKIPQVQRLQINLSQKEDEKYVKFLQRLIKIFPSVYPLRKKLEKLTSKLGLKHGRDKSPNARGAKL